MSHVPAGYHAVTVALIVKDAPRLMEFLAAVFGATVRLRMPETGTVMHAELLIDDSVVMVSEATERFGATSAWVHVYVADVDAVYDRALAAGAVTISPPEDQFYGERSANVRDPWGNAWTLATHLRNVTVAEMQRLAQAR